MEQQQDRPEDTLKIASWYSAFPPLTFHACPVSELGKLTRKAKSLLPRVQRQ